MANINLIEKRAEKLLRAGKVSTAIKEYSKIIEAKPDSLKVRRILGDLLYNSREFREANKQFEWIAEYYLREGFFNKAIAMYKRITRVDLNNENAYFKLSELYSKQGLIVEAKQIYLDLADKYKRENNSKKALNMYKKILEFDRNNIKMRLLLAKNYLKEGYNEEAIAEYLMAADILIGKKSYDKAEEILINVTKSIPKDDIIEKLIFCYKSQGRDDKAIDYLVGLGAKIYKSLSLLKILGELFFAQGKIKEAEDIYLKVAELDPEEVESILKLGKVYLQRGEYERTYNLFLPVIDKNIKLQKYEEASSLLRFIIATENTYLPALKKLASIFEQSKKEHNLIALYESMIPIYEEKKMKGELKDILEKLIKLSDSPYTYEEKLAKLDGISMVEEDESKLVEEDEREKEFILFNMRIVEESLTESDFNKAIDILKKSKKAFPRNVEVRKKLFDVYQLVDNLELSLEEGKELLDLYRALGINEEYDALLTKLSIMEPDDGELVELQKEEATNIEIDFGSEELSEQFEELSDQKIAARKMMKKQKGEDIFVLTKDASIKEEQGKTGSKTERSKNLSSYLAEIEFYINDGYFEEAGNLINELKGKYPNNKELSAIIARYEEAKKASVLTKIPEESDEINIELEEGSSSTGTDNAQMEVNSSLLGTDNRIEEEPVVLEDDISEASGDDMGITSAAGDGKAVSAREESKLDIEVNYNYLNKDVKLELEENDLVNLESDLEINLDQPDNKEEEIKEKIAQEGLPEEDDLEEINADVLLGEEEEVQEEEEEEAGDQDESDLEIDIEEDEEELEVGESSQDEEEMSTSSEPSLSIDDILDDDAVFEEEEDAAEEVGESPFSDIKQADMDMEGSDEILKDEVLFFDEEIYYDIEKNAEVEIASIEKWTNELEKQKTSTIEKNMMEIFEEFKKGVDEKIGKEDHDTRYNLGIAYKEMGLLEEAIHEFLISSKDDSKYFDSAGLLGICFREKGMNDEALNWFNKALNYKGRKKDEYLSIKYELVLTYQLKEETEQALKYAREIYRQDPNYRNITEIIAGLRKS